MTIYICTWLLLSYIDKIQIKSAFKGSFKREVLIDLLKVLQSSMSLIFNGSLFRWSIYTLKALLANVVLRVKGTESRVRSTCPSVSTKLMDLYKILHLYKCHKIFIILTYELQYIRQLITNDACIWQLLKLLY